MTIIGDKLKRYSDNGALEVAEKMLLISENLSEIEN
jgi:hypothetical protein